MDQYLTKDRIILAGAGIGVALIVSGLYLSALSNPNRFSLDPAGDWQILLLGLSGMLLTVFGLGTFLWASSHTTSEMSPGTRRNTNLGVGIGSALQLLMVFQCSSGNMGTLVGAMVLAVGTLLTIWGCIHYAQGKGYHRSTGFLGVVGIVGLMILMALPSRNKTDALITQESENRRI